MLTDSLLADMLSTLNLNIRAHKARKNDTTAKPSEYPLLHGVSTTVRQDHDQWNANSNDSGIGDELDFLHGNSIGHSGKNSPKKAMVSLPCKVGYAAQATTSTNTASSRPVSAVTFGFDWTAKNLSVYAMRMTTGGPSFIRTSSSRLNVDNLLSGLLRRTQKAGLTVRQLPTFFESFCHQPTPLALPSRYDRQGHLRHPQQQCSSTSNYPPDILSGSKYFRYRPAWCLGKGNFGQVYMCNVERLDSDMRPVQVSTRALKSTQRLRTHQLELSVHNVLQCGHTEQSYRSTFLLWMETSMKITHGGEIIGCLLLELAPGGSLQDLLATLYSAGRRMQEREAAFYLAEMACALDYMHSRGYLHLDFKADNVLVSASGHARLADFGHSMQLDSTGRAESHLMAGLGTFHLPPELLRSGSVGEDGWNQGKVVTKATDWFSYGCLAFWLVHNHYPIPPPKGLASATEYADFIENVGYARLHRTLRQSVSLPYHQLVVELLHPLPGQRLCGLTQVMRHCDVFADCFPLASAAASAAPGRRLRPSEARILIESNSLMPPFVPLPL